MILVSQLLFGNPLTLFITFRLFKIAYRVSKRKASVVKLTAFYSILLEDSVG
jgi:hypothetical protein